MKSKVLKIGTVLLTCVCLVSILAFPVSAIVSGNAELTILDTSDMYTPGVTGSEINALVTNNDTYSSAVFQVSSTGQKQVTLNFNFNSPDTYGKITVYIDSSADTTGSTVISNPSYQGVLVNGIYNRDWNYNFVNSNLVAVEYTGYIPSQFSVRTYYNCTKEITGYIVSTFEWTPIDKGSQDIIANQDKNAIEIMQNQNENTDKITNGWQGAENIDDSTANDFKDSESAALGGKTNAEIQEEVSNALDFDIDVFDSVKIGKIHSLFDNVLNVTGSWQSLYVLSLTLGLGAFLIGRRYG